MEDKNTGLILFAGAFFFFLSAFRMLRGGNPITTTEIDFVIGMLFSVGAYLKLK